MPLNLRYFPELEQAAYQSAALLHPNVQPLLTVPLTGLVRDTFLVPVKNAKPWKPWKQDRHWIFLKHKKASIGMDPIRFMEAGYEKTDWGSRTPWKLGAGVRAQLRYGNTLQAEIRWDYASENPGFAYDSILRKRNVPLGVIGSNTFVNRQERQILQGYLLWMPMKSFGLQAGFGRHFLGDGYRSLLLSDNAPEMPYLALHGNLWRFRYYSMTAALSDPRFSPDGIWSGGKFLSMHYLSWNVVPRFNISLFESIVYRSRKGAGSFAPEVNYLNPVIFFRPVEYSIGSSDNALLGSSIRWNFFREWFLYGQVFLDEFLFKNVRAFNGWQDNKQAFQLGVKSFDAFGIKGFHVLSEFNLIRPYTYYHKNTLQNYAHHGYAMAHPLGANLSELILQLRYQRGRMLYMIRANQCNVGLDGYSAEYYGQDIFGSYFSRPYDFNNRITQGVSTVIRSVEASVSYRSNLIAATLLELRIGSRELSNSFSNQSSFYGSIGIRTAFDNFLRDF